MWVTLLKRQRGRDFVQKHNPVHHPRVALSVEKQVLKFADRHERPMLLSSTSVTIKLCYITFHPRKASHGDGGHGDNSALVLYMLCAVYYSKYLNLIKSFHHPNNLGGKNCYYFHFTGEETEAQRGYKICLVSPMKRQRGDLNPGPLASESMHLAPRLCCLIARITTFFLVFTLACVCMVSFLNLTTTLWG